MSTRSSIFYREETLDEIGLHLYCEMADEGKLYLEISCGPFCCDFAVPKELSEQLKRQAA
jgi:hypothetical protein